MESQLRCYVCGSTEHFARYCPKNVFMTSGDKESIKDVKVADVKEKSQMKEEMVDAMNHALLDTACSSTVCGEDWLGCYIESLSESDKSLIKESKSDTVFKFGDGVLHQSLKKVKIPVCIVGIKTFILTDVVSCAVPLLWSKAAMKRAGLKLNLMDDTAVILKRKTKLSCTSTGHYRLPLLNEQKLKERSEEIMYTFNGDEKNKKEKIRKIHQQFGHPSVRRLKQLLKDAAVDDELCFIYAEEISMECEVCKKYKRTPSRPIVSMRFAKDFNDVVAIDLKEYNKGKIYFLHMVDMATRFTRSAIVKSKEPNVIVDKIITIWMGTGIGPPKNILCDNGGEWTNEVFMSMCENMNIRIMHTAAESAFSNGICERNHAIIDEMVNKIIEQQPNLSLTIALAWAVNSKNCLQMVEGYSPYQLVFGRNPSMPGVVDDALPALEGYSKSEIVADHLNASHRARKSFIAAESSEKIRRALRHRVRPSGKIYQKGELVYFKREKENRWKGPATVIGQDGTVVILKYGAYIVRVHETRVQNAGHIIAEENVKEKEDLLNLIKSQRESNEEIKANKENDEENQCEHESDDENMMTNDDGNAEIDDAVANKIPKIGDKVKFQTVHDDEWRSAKIHSRAGKSTGKYSGWRNIQFQDGEIEAIDWENDVSSWKLDNNDTAPVSTENDASILIVKNASEEYEAKKKELESWREFNVYEEVRNEGQKVITTRWVITSKKDKIKARLVVRGFENDDNVKADSPTASKEVMRMFIAVLASKHWSINSIDIKAAFLQSEAFERGIY